MELDLRIKYWLTKKGWYKGIGAFNLAAGRDFSYDRARNLLLHINFNKMGLSMNPRTPYENHNEVAKAIALMFEHPKYINDVGRNAVLNQLCYISTVQPKELLVTYLRTVTRLKDDDILACLRNMTNDFYSLLIQAIVGKKTTVTFKPELRKMVKDLPYLTKDEVNAFVYSSNFPDYVFLRLPEGMFLIRDQEKEQ